MCVQYMYTGVRVEYSIYTYVCHVCMCKCDVRMWKGLPIIHT